MGAPKLMTVDPLAGPRQALAEAITNRNAIRANIAALAKQSEEASAARWAAHEEVRRFRKIADEAPPLERRKAKSAADEAEAALEDHAAVRADISEEDSRLQQRLGVAEMIVGDRASDLVRMSPSVAALLDQYHAFQVQLFTLGAMLNEIGGRNLPKGRENFASVSLEAQSVRSDGRWQAAIAALFEDANAPLPA
jgi:hypothetical protein